MSMPPIDKDLANMLALGADIRGYFKGEKDSILRTIASRLRRLSHRFKG